MKKYIISLLLLFIILQVYSQDIQSKEQMIKVLQEKYQKVYLGDKFYELYDNCSNNNSIDSCWKIGLWWDYDEQDFSKVSSSKMHFYYFPKTALLCQDVTFYELTPNSNLVWQYKDKNITISARMISVESSFGYQLTDIRITNTSTESCFSPKTLFKKIN